MTEANPISTTLFWILVVVFGVWTLIITASTLDVTSVFESLSKPQSRSQTTEQPSGPREPEFLIS
jgi:hypothetical protein